MNPPPGWHPDPYGTPGHLRYWNGTAWTDQVAAPLAKAGNGNWFARHKVITAVAATVLFFGVIGAVSDGEPDTGDEAASADQDWQPDAENDDQSDEAEPAVAEEPTPEETEEPSDRDKTPKSPEPDVEREYLVVHIVDGDTLELGNGETVRLVGIDTPEVGECGFEESASRLRELVGGQAVTLGESDEDRDQYDRLLRYVDIGAMDAGYRLIRDGLATARYDSRDGYGRHPRRTPISRRTAGRPTSRARRRQSPRTSPTPAGAAIVTRATRRACRCIRRTWTARTLAR